MSAVLDKASIDDIDILMTWFVDAHAVAIWGGPRFRYPFTHDSFHEDCRWTEFASYSLRDTHGSLLAFGQLGTRYGRIHLARLVAHPQRRGQGIGKQLITSLIEEGKRKFDTAECGLFVMRENTPAYQCYLSLGFAVQPYPDDAPMRDLCFYLTKVI